MLLGSSFSSFSQISFYKLFSNNGVDLGQGITQLEDSSYIITGSSSSFFDGPSQIFLLKLDSAGNYLWSKDFGGPESDVGRRVMYKENVGYFVCGYSNSSGNGDFDMYIAKIGENLNMQWEKFIGGNGWEKVHDAALTKDTGLLLVGETTSGNANENSDIYIVRTNINGDTLWTKQIGGAGDDAANSIYAHNDSMYVIGGYRWNEDSLMSKGYIMYMKDDGTIQWEHTTGANGDYWINDVIYDGSRFAAVGGTSGATKNGIDFYFCPVSTGGGPLGPYEQPAPDDENFMCLTKYGDGTGFYIVSHREGAGFYDYGTDITVSRFLTNMTWQNGIQVGHQYPDVIGEIIPTSDGGAIMVGYSSEVVSGGNEVFVMKIGPNDQYPDPVMDEEFMNLVEVSELSLQNDDIHIYPNPVATNLNIHGAETYYKVSIIDLSGKVVLRHVFYNESLLNLSELQSGTYIVDIENQLGETRRTKLIVQH